MAGSDESDDYLAAGRVNRTNDQTTLWAENRYTTVWSVFGSDSFRIDYGGPVILLVEVAKDSENEGDFKPPAPLDAIMGVGWSAGQTGGTGVVGIGGSAAGRGVFGKGGTNGARVVGEAAGTAPGVVGLGGELAGTGVFGLGAGGDRITQRRRGGKGIHGVGGHALLQPGPDAAPPGAGVFGQGGRILEPNTDGILLGTGVIGVGGDADNAAMPTTSNAGSAGVFGQGADAQIEQIDLGGGSTKNVGPAEPGAGVVGRGGVATGARLPPAAGVIGLAGGRDKPGIFQTGDAGVFGLGSTGVRGVGVSGHGVNGSSDTDRGGVFSSREVAQAQLVPKPIGKRLPEESSVTPSGISSGALSGGVVPLPRAGQGGDLMALVDDNRMCTLWFCVTSESGSTPARWAQVLLGAAFDGQV